MSERETLLITKRQLEEWLEKLKDKTEDWSICPTCETIFDARFEACKCKDVRFA